MTLRRDGGVCYYPHMGTLQTDIQQKQKEIEQHHRDLYSLYADLGDSVALIEHLSPIGYAHQMYERLCKEMQELETARHAYEQLAGYISQMEDRSRKIKEIEADIRTLSKPKKKIFAQLGAIAWEAYGSEVLVDHVKLVCDPIFEEPQRRIHVLSERLEAPIGLIRKTLLRQRLKSERASLPVLFAKAGRQLVEIGCEADLPLKDHQPLMKELGELREREAELHQELEVHQSAMAKLQSQEVQSPKAKLDASEQVLRQAQKACEQASSVYGKELYETLPDDVNTHMIGHTALGLMDQITLHRKRIKQLENDIQMLQNMIKVQELEAQIELENQKMALLKNQIETCNRQIQQVSSSIQQKKSAIESLLPAKLEEPHA